MRRVMIQMPTAPKWCFVPMQLTLVRATSFTDRMLIYTEPCNLKGQAIAV
ncbi:MAG: hypothetical protein M3R14_12965 [Acidobacteriota bacterium]|nr:hypothetical protein [Acidobacteriota bacterium]